ncbi:aryl hydrocarbon receptor nuclear translocator-like protein 1, partial [Nephila pilipes]
KVVRLQRNQAEKQRRDRLNGYIADLASLVPMVKNSTKPVDKVSVLRLAAAHMRINASCLNPKNFKSKFQSLPASVISSLEIIEKSVGGFIVVSTFSGIIVFCSKSVEDFLGYQNIDFMGQSIYHYVHNKEVAFFEKKINAVISRYKKGNSKKVSKIIKLHLQKRPLPRSGDVSYQKMSFKISVHSNESLEGQGKVVASPLKGKKISKHKDFGTSAVILMFIEPVKTSPKINLPNLLIHQDIYFTIHGLQGEIMYADHRISTITGYMPRDVLGTSAYHYIFETDVPIALFAQNAMFTSCDGMGLITYRLKTFNSKYIYLQSKGQIVFKDSSTEISHFICYNRWLSNEEGAQELKKFQERFSPQSMAGGLTDVMEDKSACNILCLDSSNKTPSTSFSESSSPSLLNPLMQSSNNCYSVNSLNDSVSPLPYSLIHTSSDDCEGNISDMNFNSINNTSGLSFNEQQPVKDEKFWANNSDEINHSEFITHANINDYEKIEKMEICSYDESSNHIGNKHFIEHENSIVSPPINPLEKNQDINLAHCPRGFIRDNLNSYSSSHFNIKTKNSNHMFQKDVAFPSSIPNVKQKRQNSYTNMQLMDTYNVHNSIQTNEISSSVKPADCHSFEGITSEQNSIYSTMYPASMNCFKMPETVSQKNTVASNDLPNLSSLNLPSMKESFTSHSYYHHNNEPVETPNIDFIHQHNGSSHLNISGNGACNISSYKKCYTCDDFSSNGDIYDGNLYNNNISNHSMFEYQELNSPKDNTLKYPENNMLVKENYTDFSQNFSVQSSANDKWDLLNNWSYSKKKSSSVTTFNSKNAIQRKNTNSQCPSEVLINKDNLHQKPVNQSSSVNSFANQESNFDASVNQDLYNELDMFFENLPVSTQNEYSFEAQSTQL